MGAQDIADGIFEALGGKKTGEGYQVKCPCHEDKTESLSIGIVEGRVVWHCKAGCNGADIWEELNKRGLLKSSTSRGAAAPEHKSRKEEKAGAAIDKKLVDTYRYPDGVEKLRYEPKDFRVRRKVEAKEGEQVTYIWKEATKGWKPQLYLLPRLEKAIERDDVILLCEGEKDVKNFLQLRIPGYFATTNLEGSSTWRREYTAQLRGARIIICEDNDEAGRKRTLLAGEALRAKSIVKVLRFTDLPPKADLSDMLEAVEDLERVEIRIETAAVPFRLEEYVGLKQGNVEEKQTAEEVVEEVKTPPPGMAQEEAPSPSVGPEERIHTPGYEKHSEDITPRATQAPDDNELTPKPKKVKEATREDYFQLFEAVLGPLPRDIFSGDCMRLIGKTWEPAENALPKVKSEAHFLETSKIRKYSMLMVDNHYHEYTDRKQKQFLFPIPAWDGHDRLKTMAECLILEDDQAHWPVTVVEQQLKAWASGIFRKLEDPRFQNPILILKGAQGIGKDYFINTLTDGFGQWSKHLSLSRNDADNLSQLGNAAVLKIAEFDRTSRTDIATIKDMIFRDTFSVRAAYARKAKDSECRASFAATCNVEDIYRDPTGNRRFTVFNLRTIIFRYGDSPADSAQLLAQAKTLADAKYKPDDETLEAMREYIRDKTPESIEDLAADRWNYEVTMFLLNPFGEDTTLQSVIKKRGWVTNYEATSTGIMERVSKGLGTNVLNTRRLLKSAGLAIISKLGGITNRGFSFAQVDLVTGVTGELQDGLQDEKDEYEM